ncbi:autotransporter outer membrane beta-barrel domain-containing protein [Asticcacaulis sp. ZE23SCel15]|uniref:autotransporter outer membrane beta-barrel domain-containing protein n=1 Tax=Asticcacaulis sp. ZE23SCel15 TaxID=3059027 RepID=UPI00265ED4A4|nr:autotransporter outer membrane beta-barrel domain-containing protein [Asticcacaulis sp. ZE23SCel15]WKL57583.1 autotransporter outer membrane beta-barrel domain-containing protein [Asticcacaulis sp. ZE23SCel15]
MPISRFRCATSLGLILTVGAVPVAWADTTVSTATTTPVATSTGGNVDVTSDGSITLTSGTAVTVDSDNTVTLNGTLEMSGSDSNATGVLISGARTTTVDLSGTITVTDDYTAEDEDDDDLVDGVFAEGTGRYGVRATGLLTGAVDIDSTITVQGNQSYGISLEGGRTGDFIFDGSISVLGDEVVGLNLAGTQTGQTYISGSISATGKDLSAVDISGLIDGALIIDGSISGTGYRYTSIGEDYLDLLEADDLYQNKALVSISNDVTQGVLINAGVTSTDDDNTDENGNGIEDTEEGTASIAQYGGNAALLIGSDSKAITLSPIVVADTAIEPDEINHGLDIRGSIASYGIYEGIDATAVQIAGLGYDATITNGISISGSVGSTAYEGIARGLSLLAGAQVGQLDISGSLGASSTTTDYDTAYGLDIASGANLSALNIKTGGAITAYGYGTTANATAIRDQSNTLTSITVNGSITASITPGDEDEDDVTDTAVNRAVAIDLSGNTVATNLNIIDEYPDDDDYAAPYIAGDVKFGSGNDSLSMSGGYLYGNVDFGAGANSLSLSDDAILLGKLTGGGTVAVDIADARLGLSAGSQLNLSSLHLGSEAELYMVLQTQSPDTPILINSGTTTFDDGAALYLSLDEIIQTPTRFTLMTGSNIDYGTLDLEDMDENVPWLYKVALATGEANTNLYADFRVRTQAESGLNVSEYSALSAILTAAATDEDTTTTMLSETTQSGFTKVYTAFLPDYSGENLLTLSKGHQALNQSLAKQSFLPDAGQTQYWLQEYGYSLKRERGETTGFESTGFSFAGGAERGLGSHQAIGVYVSYTTTSPQDTYATANETTSAEDITVGGYWRVNAGKLKGWASAGMGRTMFKSERELLSDYSALISTGKWSGYSLSGNFGASYETALGPVSVKPVLSVDYYGLKEDARTETGGGSSFDLSIDDRTSHLASAAAILYLGRAKTDALIRPEAWVGYRSNFSVNIDDTVARFGDGTPFTLTGGDIKGGAPVVGMRISAGNEYGYLSLEAEGEKYSDYDNYSISLRTGFKF